MDPIIKIKCDACNSECSVEQIPGQIINHELLLRSRLISVTEQLAGVKKKDSPNFLALTQEKQELESSLKIWSSMAEQARAILHARGTAHWRNKDPG